MSPKKFMSNETPKSSNNVPVVLITGASTGVGLALTRRLIKRNLRLALTARKSSLDRFQKEGVVESDKVKFIELDVTNHDSRIEAVEKINQLWGGVDILVNNAAISYRAVVEHMNDEEEIMQLATNYLGPMALIRLVLPHMRKNGWGKILNISSVSGMMAMPTMSSYSASKFALEGATESLWYEMKPWNIQVSLIQPGFIHSNSFENVYYSEQSKQSTITHGPYWDYYESMGPFVKKMMGLSRHSSEDVAKTIEKTINNPRPSLRVAATPDAGLFYWIRRMLPRPIYHRLLYWGLPGARHWAKDKKNYHE